MIDIVLGIIGAAILFSGGWALYCMRTRNKFYQDYIKERRRRRK